MLYWNMTMIVNDSDVTNGSAGAPPAAWRHPVLVTFKVVVVTLLLLIMLAMGCNTSPRLLWQQLRHPGALLIGLAAQFVLLPLLSFGAAHALRVEAHYALSILIMSCCPGGATSNLFTYWADGAISLSIAMTTVSTALAIGFMPLNLFIYSRSWTSQSAVIPYKNIVISLVCILVPLSVGMLIKHKSDRLAHRCSQVGSAAGMLSIFTCIGLQVALYLHEFLRTPWQLYLASLTIPLAAFLLGGGLAWLLRQPASHVKAVSFETGCQNVSLAISLTLTSFPAGRAQHMLMYPMLYGVWLVLEGMLVAALIRACASRKSVGGHDTTWAVGDNEDHHVGHNKRTITNGAVTSAEEMELVSTQENGDVNHSRYVTQKIYFKDAVPV